MAQILVVDDETNIRMMLRLALRQDGHTVETAADGAEALEKFGDDGCGFDLTLLDQRMPGIEGLDVLRRMRTRRPDARVILITAFGTFDLATEAARAGAKDFLRKPFTLETLRGAVNVALRPEDDRDCADPPPLSGINGYRVLTEPGGEFGPDHGWDGAYTVEGPDGIPLPVRVRLAPTALDGNTDAAFARALGGEALANHLWQNAEPPPDGLLTLDALTPGLRRWVEAARRESEYRDGPA